MNTTVDRLMSYVSLNAKVRQGCVTFNIVVDWVMNKTPEGPTQGIRWTLFCFLEDINVADNIAFLPHTP